MNPSIPIKKRIIEATKELLSTQGHITIKAIADHCYINIAAVNYHFSSKENLLSIVIQDVIEDLKTMITKSIMDLPPNISAESTLKKMLDIIYTFAIENTGIITYLFLQKEYQTTMSNLLIKEFFTDSPFTKLILKKISESSQIKDEDTIKVKYMLLFSSFSIPLFIQMLEEGDTNKNITSLKDPNFKKKYITELLRIIQ